MQFVIEDIPEKGTIPEKCWKKLKAYAYYPFIRIKPTNCVMPSLYKDYIETVRNFPVRQDDVYLVSNPKCGTTWSMEMVWMVANDLDFEKAKEISLFKRFPHIDNIGCIDHDLIRESNEHNVVEILESQSSQRFVKSHLPKDLLPTQIWEKKTKVIFIIRNPKDAAISNYHHYGLFHGYSGTLEEFLEATLRDEVTFSPFWEQVIPFWNMRNEPNVLFIKYEDMKANLDGVLQSICDFFGKKYTAAQMTALKEHLSVSEMKNNRSVNYQELKEHIHTSIGDKREGSFVREGQSGGWRNIMTPEMAARFDEWTMRQIKGTGLEELYGS